MSEGIVTKSSEATRGGFQAIKVVSGVLQPVTRVPAPPGFTGFGNKPANDQAKIVLEDAEIIEMEEGEPEPELKDGKFTTWMGYAAPSKDRPHVNSFYVKGFCESGERIEAKRRGVNAKDGLLSNLYGTRVTLSRQTVELFKKPKEDNKDEKEVVTGTGYVFIDDSDLDVENIGTYITKLVLGKNASSAKRALIMDAKAKRYPEYKEALDNGTLAEKLGIAIVDGLFQEGEK